MSQLIKNLIFFVVRWFKTKTIWVKDRGSDTSGFLRGSFLRPYKTSLAGIESLPSVIDRPYVVKLPFGNATKFPEAIIKTFRGPYGSMTLSGTAFARKERRLFRKTLKGLRKSIEAMDRRHKNGTS